MDISTKNAVTDDVCKCIFEIPETQLDLVAKIIRQSFDSVAKDFNLTEQNCPNHTSFIKVEKLQNHFNWGWLMYGIYDNERLVGYVSLSKEDERIFELHNLAVLPEYRHKGYGKLLLEFCKAKITEHGGNKITIGIIEESTMLKNWYAANGFIHTGTKKFEHLPFTVGYMEWRRIH